VEEQSAVTRDMSGNMQVAAQAVEAICGDVEGIAAAARQADAASKDAQDAVRELASA
jgi:methyl-accepting chemotaxis protein